MTLKDDGRQRESKLKKKHKMVKCPNCNYKNDYDEMLDNEDVDFVGESIYIYCLKCAEQIQVK